MLFERSGVIGDDLVITFTIALLSVICVKLLDGVFGSSL